MKTGLLSLVSIALFQLTAALPYDKRAIQNVEVYEEIQVYVEDDGTPVLTATRLATQNSVAEPTAQPIALLDHGPKPPPSSPSALSAPQPGSNLVPEQPQAPASSGPGFKNGIAYSPYGADHGCRSADEIAKDVSKLTDYSVIRLYGTDCEQLSSVLAALKSKQTQVFAGIFDINNVQADTQSLIQQVNGNWAQINTVSIGNELVNSNSASVEQVTSAVEQVRNILRGAGWQGPVVAVDTMVAMRSHPELCKASDYCAINCHAFFDGNVLPEDAGGFVRDFVHQIENLSGGKEVVVTESGWPSSGSPNNRAIPSPENQKKAIQSLKAAFDKDLILYSAFDHKWMNDNIKTFNAEQHWGILGTAPSSS